MENDNVGTKEDEKVVETVTNNAKQLSVKNSTTSFILISSFHHSYLLTCNYFLLSNHLLWFYYNYDKQTMRFTLIKAAPASAEDGTSKLDITPSLSNMETINNLPVIEKYSGNYLLGETAFFKAYHMFFTKEYNTPKGWQ